MFLLQAVYLFKPGMAPGCTAKFYFFLESHSLFSNCSDIGASVLITLQKIDWFFASGADFKRFLLKMVAN